MLLPVAAQAEVEPHPLLHDHLSPQLHEALAALGAAHAAGAI